MLRRIERGANPLISTVAGNGNEPFAGKPALAPADYAGDAAMGGMVVLPLAVAGLGIGPVATCVAPQLSLGRDTGEEPDPNTEGEWMCESPYIWNRHEPDPDRMHQVSCRNSTLLGQVT